MAYLSTVNAIPKMTSNTTPSGIVTASTENSSYPAYRAFDKTIGTYGWLSTALTAWIQYEFPSPIAIKRYTLTSDQYPLRAPKNWTFEASNDGVNWTIIDTQTNQTGWGSNSLRSFDTNNTTQYKIYRINVTENNGDTTRISIDEIEMFEWVYENKFLIQTSDDRKISLIVPDENKDIIPKMTSANTPSGVVSASSIASSNYAWNAFDDVTTGNGWLANGTTNQWICYQFPEPKRVGKYTLIVTYNVTVAPKDWTFEGSNDGQNWIVLDNRSNITDWVAGTKKVFYIDKNKIGSYSYYRVNASVNNGNASHISLGEIEMMETVISLINVPELSGAYYIKYGMDKNAEINLMTEIYDINCIQNQADILGTGKVFRQMIDTSKTPIKKVSIK